MSKLKRFIKEMKTDKEGLSHTYGGLIAAFLTSFGSYFSPQITAVLHLNYYLFLVILLALAIGLYLILQKTFARLMSVGPKEH